MKIHEIKRSTVTGNPLVVAQEATSVVFSIPVPAEGLIKRFSLAVESDGVPTITAVDLYDAQPSSTDQAYNHICEVIPTQTSAPVQYIGEAAYSVVSRRDAAGGTLFLKITAGSNIPANSKFALSLVIHVGGAIM